MTCRNLLLETDKRYDFKSSGIKFEAAYCCIIKQRSERERLDLLSELLLKGLEKSLSGKGCPFVENGDFDKCPRYEVKNNLQINKLKAPA